MVRISVTALILLFGSSIISVAAQQCGTQNSNTVCDVGKCCSQYGWCDTTPAHCDPANCQHAFSGAGSSCAAGSTTLTTATTTTTTTSTSTTTATGGGAFESTVPSIDSCGTGSGGVSCPGAGLGGYFYRCCSVNGHCGPKNSEQAQTDYCGTGCQPGYGKCDPGRPVPAAPTAPPTTSTDGHCGPIVNKKCPTTECCSGSNYCGTGTDFCGAANWCQVNFGVCHR